MRALDGCSEDELRSLVRDEDAPPRVRAAWALALRLGAGAVDELRIHERTEPSVGVRRHLLVVLAGLHQVELLAAIARDDADERVRTTAGSCLARRVRDDRAAVDAVIGCLRDERAAPVRAAIVEALPERAPPAIEDALERVIAGPRDDLTKTAILDRVIARDGFAAAIALLERRRRLASRLRGAVLDRWLASEPAGQVLAALRDARWRVLADVLARCRDYTLPWSALAALAERDDPRLDAAITWAFDGRSADPVPFFVTVLERARDPWVATRACRELICGARRGALGRDPLAARGLAACERLVDREGDLGPTARAAVAELRWVLGTPDRDGWFGHAGQREGVTPVDHAEVGEPPYVLARAGTIEIRIPADTFEQLTHGLGARAGAVVSTLWREGEVTLPGAELAELASRAGPADPALFADLGTLATRAEVIRFELEHRARS